MTDKLVIDFGHMSINLIYKTAIDKPVINGGSTVNSSTCIVSEAMSPFNSYNHTRLIHSQGWHPRESDIGGGVHLCPILSGQVMHSISILVPFRPSVCRIVCCCFLLFF